MRLASTSSATSSSQISSSRTRSPDCRRRSSSCRPGRRRPSGIVKHNERTLLEDERFFAAITKRELLDIVSETLGDDLQLVELHVGMPQPLATVVGRRLERVQRCDAVLTANVAIYLQDMTEAAGPLLVLPGSHSRRRAPAPLEEGVALEGEVPVGFARAGRSSSTRSSGILAGATRRTGRAAPSSRTSATTGSSAWTSSIAARGPTSSSSTTIRSSASCSGWESPSRPSTAAMTR
jgi:hypothetical protein